jgi:hypothetical protein
MKKKFQKMTITLENVDQAQAIALKKMFKYMEYLGNIGSSRLCSFYADGDGDFRPKVSFEYPEELPDVHEISGIITSSMIQDAKANGKRILNSFDGDFAIDFDTIAGKIYH